MGDAKRKPAPSDRLRIPVSNIATVKALEVLRGHAEASAGRAAQKELARAIKALEFAEAEQDEMDRIDDEGNKNNLTQPSSDPEERGAFFERVVAQRTLVRSWRKRERVLILTVDIVRALFSHLTAHALPGEIVEAIDEFEDVLEDAKNGEKKYLVQDEPEPVHGGEPGALPLGQGQQRLLEPPPNGGATTT